jgi:hypothetical protein
MKKLVLGGVVGLVVLFVLIQFIPVDRHNPPVESEISAPPEVKAILQRSCYDCHSNQTVWPWYSRIAPSSWMVASDVHEGREKLNFSTWDQYSTQKQVKKRQEIWEKVSEGEMPPWLYTLAHHGVRLSADDRAILRAWMPASQRHAER